MGAAELSAGMLGGIGQHTPELDRIGQSAPDPKRRNLHELTFHACQILPRFGNQIELEIWTFP
jgi:hypothetical protein